MTMVTYIIRGQNTLRKMEWNIQVESRIRSHPVKLKYDFSNNATFSDVTHAVSSHLSSKYIKYHVRKLQPVFLSTSCRC